MSNYMTFYADTAEEAEQKARDYAAKLDFMQQPRVSKAVSAPATITFNPDGTQSMKQLKGKYCATVNYYGLD